MRLRAKGKTRFGTPVFAPSTEFADWTENPMNPYPLIAAPKVYPGQTLRAQLLADRNTEARIYVGYYDNDDNQNFVYSEATTVAGEKAIEFRIPAEVYPAFEIGLATEGTVHLDSLRWHGEPNYQCTRTGSRKQTMKMWRRAWVNGVDDRAEHPWAAPFQLTQNPGRRDRAGRSVL